MLSRSHRFVGPASLRFVYRQGQTVRGPLFTLKAVLNNRRSSYRAAVVVSRKVHKSAVVRNRIRRRLYEAIRSSENDISGSYDLVLNVFSAKVLEESPKKLADQLKRQLAGAGVLARRLKSDSGSSS